MLNWEDTRMWISKYDRTSIEDLVIPRVAWLRVVGLPFIAATKQVLEKLIDTRGSLKGISINLEDSNQIPVTRISLYTKSGELLNFSRTVTLDNKVYKVWFKEEVGTQERSLPLNSRIYSLMRSPIFQEVASSTKDHDLRIEKSE